MASESLPVPLLQGARRPNHIGSRSPCCAPSRSRDHKPVSIRIPVCGVPALLMLRRLHRSDHDYASWNIRHAQRQCDGAGDLHTSCDTCIVRFRRSRRTSGAETQAVDACCLTGAPGRVISRLFNRTKLRSFCLAGRKMGFGRTVQMNVN
jgi:hypothetical protein